MICSHCNNTGLVYKESKRIICRNCNIGFIPKFIFSGIGNKSIERFTNNEIKIPDDIMLLYKSIETNSNNENLFVIGKKLLLYFADIITMAIIRAGKQAQLAYFDDVIQLQFDNYDKYNATIQADNLVLILGYDYVKSGNDANLKNTLLNKIVCERLRTGKKLYLFFFCDTANYENEFKNKYGNRIYSLINDDSEFKIIQL